MVTNCWKKNPPLIGKWVRIFLVLSPNWSWLVTENISHSIGSVQLWVTAHLISLREAGNWLSAASLSYTGSSLLWSEPRHCSNHSESRWSHLCPKKNFSNCSPYQATWRDYRKKKCCLSLMLKKVTELSAAKMDLLIPTWKNYLSLSSV